MSKEVRSLAKVNEMIDDGSIGGGGGSPNWGDIGGTLANQTDLNTALIFKAHVSGNSFKTFKCANGVDDTEATNLGQLKSVKTGTVLKGDSVTNEAGTETFTIAEVRVLLNGGGSTQGQATAWGVLNADGVKLDGFNVASSTFTSSYYEVVFSTPMVTVNYAVTIGINTDINSGGSLISFSENIVKTTTGFTVRANGGKVLGLMFSVYGGKT